jgi:hypothetical protein
MDSAERYNTFSENSVFNNGELGIDLLPAGPNPNDTGDIDSGPNDLLNFPVIDSVYFISGAAVIYGYLDVTSPANTKVELFIAAPDITGYGEGKNFLGSTFPLPNGNWRDTVTGVSPFDFITATATDSTGNTSEFSFCNPYPPVIVFQYDKNPIRLNVQPNPFSESTRITLSGAGIETSRCSVKVFNVSGSLVLTTTSTNGSIKIDGAGLKPGVYFCNISVDGKELPAIRILKR